MNSFDQYRISCLVDLLLEEKISEEEFEELEAYIQDSDFGAKWYRHCISTHIDIEHFNYHIFDKDSQKPNTITPFLKTSFALAAGLCLCIALLYFLLLQSSSNASPIINHQADKISIHFKDGSELTLSPDSTFSIVDPYHIAIHKGHFIADRPFVEGPSTLNISFLNKNIQLKSGKLAFQQKGDHGELRNHNAQAHIYENDHTKSTLLEPGRLYLTSQQGLVPHYFNNSNFVNAVFHSSFTKFYSGFGESHSASSPQWKQKWLLHDEYSKGNIQHQASQPLFQTTGRYLNLSTEASQGPQTITMPSSDVRIEEQGFATQFITQYQSTESFDIHQKHSIEFLIRINSNPNDIARLSIFDAQALEENEPFFFKRAWSIVAGYPKKYPNIIELSWFVQNKDNTQATLKVAQGMTYSILIEIDPVLRIAKTVISDGVNTIYNEKRKKPPLFGRDREKLSGILKFMVYGKPDAKIDISIDEMSIRNFDNSTQKQFFAQQ